MKKTVFAALVLACPLFAHAQVLEVESVTRVDVPGDVKVGQATLNPLGTMAVISPLSGQGISSLDFATGTVREISATASPMMLSFTADGNTVLYRESSYTADHRRLVSLNAFDVLTGASRQLLEPSRSLQGFAVQGAMAVAVDNGRIKAKSLNNNTVTSAAPVLSIDRGNLCITRDGVTTVLNPLGERCNSYLWESISPDGNRILAFGVGSGAFTCNLDGSDVRMLGMIRAAVWYGDNVVLGMDSRDNGIVNVYSRIMAVPADGGDMQAVTPEDTIALFPSAAPGKIAFTTPDGEMYIVNVK